MHCYVDQPLLKLSRLWAVGSTQKSCSSQLSRTLVTLHMLPSHCLYAQRSRTGGSVDTLAAELAADAKVAEAMALLEAAERRRVGSADDMDQGPEDGRGQGEGGRGAGQGGSRAGAATGNEGQGVDEWAPPQNQTGDGRTALNQRFGY